MFSLAASYASTFQSIIDAFPTVVISNSVCGGSTILTGDPRTRMIYAGCAQGLVGVQLGGGSSTSGVTLLASAPTCASVSNIVVDSNSNVLASCNSNSNSNSDAGGGVLQFTYPFVANVGPTKVAGFGNGGVQCAYPQAVARDGTGWTYAVRGTEIDSERRYGSRYGAHVKMSVVSSCDMLD